MAGKDTHVSRDGGNVDLGDIDVLVDGLSQDIFLGVSEISFRSKLGGRFVVSTLHRKSYLVRNSKGQAETGGGCLSGVSAS